jgi:hypothetical protein
MPSAIGSLSQLRTKLPPIKPAPPVTKILVFSEPCFIHREGRTLEEKMRTPRTESRQVKIRTSAIINFIDVNELEFLDNRIGKRFLSVEKRISRDFFFEIFS